jgi:hypothetical protein
MASDMPRRVVAHTGTPSILVHYVISLVVCLGCVPNIEIIIHDPLKDIVMPSFHASSLPHWSYNMSAKTDFVMVILSFRHPNLICCFHEIRHIDLM